MPLSAGLNPEAKRIGILVIPSTQINLYKAYYSATSLTPVTVTPSDFATPVSGWYHTGLLIRISSFIYDHTGILFWTIILFLIWHFPQFILLYEFCIWTLCQMNVLKISSPSVWQRKKEKQRETDIQLSCQFIKKITFPHCLYICLPLSVKNVPRPPMDAWNFVDSTETYIYYVFPNTYTISEKV